MIFKFKMRETRRNSSTGLRLPTLDVRLTFRELDNITLLNSPPTEIALVDTGADICLFDLSTFKVESESKFATVQTANTVSVETADLYLGTLSISPNEEGEVYSKMLPLVGKFFDQGAPWKVVLGMHFLQDGVLSLDGKNGQGSIDF